jgi:3-oxoacyl-[acyl-carrier protein] reductase
LLLRSENQLPSIRLNINTSELTANPEVQYLTSSDPKIEQGTDESSSKNTYSSRHGRLSWAWRRYCHRTCSRRDSSRYLQNKAAADNICERIRNAGGRAHSFQADVREENEVARLIFDVTQVFGDVDILVPNATVPQPFLSIEEQTWSAYLTQLEFFVKSPLLLVKLVLPGMRLHGFGRIINIGSEVAELGNPKFANFVSAKAAQLGLTRSWARELATNGITVNLVAPGWIPTERHADATREEIDAYSTNVPMKRMGTPEDVAKLVAFLASDATSFITGQSFAVNGGNTLA